MRARTGNVFNDVKILFDAVKKLGNGGGLDYSTEQGQLSDKNYLTSAGDRLVLKNYKLVQGKSEGNLKEVMFKFTCSPAQQYGGYGESMHIKLNDDLLAIIGDLDDYAYLNVSLRNLEGSDIYMGNHTIVSYKKSNGENYIAFYDYNEAFWTNDTYEIYLYLKKE